MTDSVIIKIVNLTDTERRIAYNYEMQNALNVGNNGKKGKSFQKLLVTL